MSALWLEKVFVKVNANINQHQELWSFETENSRYYDLKMSALWLEKVFVKVYANINQHQALFRMQEQ